MGILLRPYQKTKCCLCGASGSLSGEHKIKLSALRDEFGNVPLYIGNYDDVSNPMRLAQSPKSRLFHFTGKICTICNGARTQKPDRIFDEYHYLVKESIESSLLDHWNDGIFQPPRFEYNSEKSRELFRYFSKILCCRLAESEGPTPIYLAKHAVGEFEKNRVWLQVRRDPVQKRFSEQFGDWPYAAHGGLVIYSNKNTGKPGGFHSSITIRHVQCIFWFRLHWTEILEMKLLHKKFYHKCMQCAEDMRINSLSDYDLEKIGFR
jgi:hypothetical protein